MSERGTNVEICVFILCTAVFYVNAIQMRELKHKLSQDERDVLQEQMGFWKKAPEVEKVLSGEVMELVPEKDVLEVGPEFTSYDFKFVRAKDGVVCNATYKIIKNAIGNHKWKCPSSDDSHTERTPVTDTPVTEQIKKAKNKRQRKRRKPKTTEKYSEIDDLFADD